MGPLLTTVNLVGPITYSVSDGVGEEDGCDERGESKGFDMTVDGTRRSEDNSSLSETKKSESVMESSMSMSVGCEDESTMSETGESVSMSES